MKIQEASTKELRALLKDLNFTIDTIEAYGAKDLIVREVILHELKKREGLGQ